MKQMTKEVEKIAKHYVGDDCIQVAFPYDDTLTLFDENGILFHYKPESSYYVNKYLDDERRSVFPYSNVPNYFLRNGLFKKTAYTRQILDFEKPYISVGSGFVTENFALKKDDCAFLIKNIMKFGYKMSPDFVKRSLNYDELLDLVRKNNDSEKVYYVNLDGSILDDENQLFPSEENIQSYIKSELMELANQLKNGASINEVLIDNPWMLKYVDANMKSPNYSLTSFNIEINDFLLVIRINDMKISIQGIVVEYVKENTFNVNVFNVPITKYTLEQIRLTTKINTSKEKRIPLSINPGISKKDIAVAKKMIKLRK